jgi:hypothetical protein
VSQGPCSNAGIFVIKDVASSSFSRSLFCSSMARSLTQSRDGEKLQKRKQDRRIAWRGNETKCLTHVHEKHDSITKQDS